MNVFTAFVHGLQSNHASRGGLFFCAVFALAVAIIAAVNVSDALADRKRVIATCLALCALAFLIVGVSFIFAGVTL